MHWECLSRVEIFIMIVGGLTLANFIMGAIDHYLGELFPFIFGTPHQIAKAILKQGEKGGSI